MLLVDDGLATGSTMRAAIIALRRGGAARIVAAVPVAPAHVCDELAQEADEMICAYQPAPLRPSERGYTDFTQTTDDDVRTLLDQAASRTRQ